ncbi:MAG: (Fe-S)-binding protein, partial [Xanthobacteraceae bacterium]
MSLPPRAPFPSLIPESAPFSAEQRVWLDGLFAGLLSLEHGVTPLSAEQAAALLPGALDLASPSAATTDDDDDDAPWHDPAMPLNDRMKLAESRPLRRRMMAAMGQQDCGQCGYTCQDYSDAIFSEKEKRLNLCVPGGKETSRMLKTLHQELGQTPAASKTAAIPPETLPPADATGAPATAPGCSRESPAQAIFLSRTRLNKPGSEKETWHVELDLSSTGIDYCVGDAFGVFPLNHPPLVDAVISALDAPPDFPIGGRTLRDVLLDGVSLGAAPDMLFQLFSYITGGERRQKAKALAAGEDPDGDAATLDV